MPVNGKVVAQNAANFGFMTPYEGYDNVLAEYALWETRLPKNEAMVIDLHTPMDAYLEIRRAMDPDFSFARKDGIHPDALRHLLMAQIVSGGLGVPVGR